MLLRYTGNLKTFNMTVRMNWSDATFKMSDVIKLGFGLITAVIFIVTMSNGFVTLKDDVAEIRATQVENTKKNDLRWQIIEAKQVQLELSQRLLEQRMDAFDKK